MSEFWTPFSSTTCCESFDGDTEFLSLNGEAVRSLLVSEILSSMWLALWLEQFESFLCLEQELLSSTELFKTEWDSSLLSLEDKLWEDSQMEDSNLIEVSGFITLSVFESLSRDWEQVISKFVDSSSGTYSWYRESILLLYYLFTIFLTF